MLPYERQEQLLALLKSNKSATVTQLARPLYVSEASVRRDIERLESRGLVRRVYGGVMLADAASPVPVEPGTVPIRRPRRRSHGARLHW